LDRLRGVKALCQLLLRFFCGLPLRGVLPPECGEVVTEVSQEDNDRQMAPRAIATHT
jgi:hypothetical protein